MLTLQLLPHTFSIQYLSWRHATHAIPHIWILSLNFFRSTCNYTLVPFHNLTYPCIKTCRFARTRLTLIATFVFQLWIDFLYNLHAKLTQRLLQMIPCYCSLMYNEKGERAFCFVLCNQHFFPPSFPHAKLHHFPAILTFKRTQQEQQNSLAFQRSVQICKTVLNKSPTRCNGMQSDLFHCRVTVHVSGVTAPIIRSTTNCNRSLRYRS